MLSDRHSFPSRKTQGGKTFKITSRELDKVTDKHSKRVFKDKVIKKVGGRTKAIKNNPGYMRGITKGLKALGPIGLAAEAYMNRNLSRSEKRQKQAESMGVRTLRRQDK